MTEFEKALSEYEGIPIKHFEDEPIYLHLISNLKMITHFERPDGFLVADNTVFIVEHFEFDSSKVVKNKGSISRSELSRINREFEKYPVDSDTAYRDRLNISPSSDSYINNAIHNIQKHYYKIPHYKEKLLSSGIISDSPIIKVGFFIEDVTKLGSYYQTNNGLVPLNLAKCKQFLDEFSCCTDLDFCICANSYSNTSNNDIFTLFRSTSQDSTIHRQLSFVSKSSIDINRKNQLDMTRLEYAAFIPQTFGIKCSLF